MTNQLVPISTVTYPTCSTNRANLTGSSPASPLWVGPVTVNKNSGLPSNGVSGSVAPGSSGSSLGAATVELGATRFSTFCSFLTTSSSGSLPVNVTITWDGSDNVTDFAYSNSTPLRAAVERITDRLEKGPIHEELRSLSSQVKELAQLIGDRG
jgi:hypothetical protein